MLSMARRSCYNIRISMSRASFGVQSCVCLGLLQGPEAPTRMSDDIDSVLFKSKHDNLADNMEAC